MTGVEREQFGTTPAGQVVERLTLTSAGGITARILTLGGILQELWMPGSDGRAINVLLGYGTLRGYLADRGHLGAIVGRYANRIAGGRFTLDGVEHRLSLNDPPNTLHGGERGIDTYVWEIAETDDASGFTLRMTSPDGDQGFPGTLDVGVRYELDDDELRLHYRATTDRPTVVNLTNHAYWNLRDGGAGTIEDHLLQVDARSFTPIDGALIPTGELADVRGTPFDFTEPTRVGTRLHDRDVQLDRAGGYDHNFVIEPVARDVRRAVRLVEPRSGRSLDVLTDLPGVQVYTGNMLTGAYAKRAGIAFETQLFPDAPNHPAFPSSVLRPGETFESTTIYRFGIAA